MSLSEPAVSGLTRLSRAQDGALLVRPVIGLACIAWLIFAAASSAMTANSYIDYVGADNDDVLRLVQVRDLLAGQGWFDLNQYRLGLEGGTPMHWSRLIDLPIALLIAGFSVILGPEVGEMAGVLVWPVLTAFPLFLALAVAGFRLGGKPAAGIALAMGGLYALAINRFAPGSIDHHNVQMALMMIMVAGIVGPTFNAAAFAASGAAAAFAIAIGAETTPLVAVGGAAVALLWLFEGERMRLSASAFGLGMAGTLSVLFFLLVPPSSYPTVACDALSTGFYVLGVVGASGLFLSASLASRFGISGRLAALGLTGVTTAGFAVLIAPECLGSPLANLDPLLTKMWLNQVSEAQSIIQVIREDAWTAAGFYAVPVIALVVAIRQVVRGENRQVALVLAGLIAAAFAISCVQVRGAAFSNLFAFLVLAPVVAGLRATSNSDPKNIRAGAAFAGMVFASTPIVWSIVGAVLGMGWAAASGQEAKSLPVTQAPVCTSRQALSLLAAEPTGVVSAPSNLGASILRFTAHRTLSGPYHRNQGGMLTELHATMANPRDAIKYLRGAGVTLLAYCPSDPQTDLVVSVAPDGLAAAIGRGDIPDWLQKGPSTEDGALTVYRVLP